MILLPSVSCETAEGRITLSLVTVSLSLSLSFPLDISLSLLPRILRHNGTLLQRQTQKISNRSTNCITLVDYRQIDLLIIRLHLIAWNQFNSFSLTIRSY